MLKITNEQKNELNALALSKLLSSLREFGNDPGPKQIKALSKVIETYTDISSGHITGRYAFPLPTGTGKTRSIIAWLSAVNDLGLDSLSVTVCASKVEALCDLKRALEKEGIPSGKIGLIHSYKYNKRVAEDYLHYDRVLSPGHASEDSDRTEDIDQKQILLLTHQRVKGNTWIKEYNHYQGNKRDLMIWDETLIGSESFVFPDDEISSAISRIEGLRKGSSPIRHKALEYLKSCVEVVNAEIERQKSPGSEPELIRLPFLNGYELEEFKVSLGDLDGSDTLRSLLDVSQEKLRVLRNVAQGGGALTFKIVVPRDLKNIVILDASHNVRLLAQMDDSIQTVPIPKDIITYENVKVHQLWFPSGRTTMNKEFSPRRGNRKVSKEIADVIKGIPEGESILIFVFKKRNWLDQKERLLCDLKDNGIDIDAIISGKSRIVVLTWGNETSISQYSYCSHIIFAGVLHRSHLDIGSAIIGQRQDLLSSVSNKLIREVLQSEIVHCLYQAFSRGSCRVIQGSKTKSMTVWLIHNEKIQDLISEAMPGIRWDTWEGKYLVKKARETKFNPVVQKISEYLGQLQVSQVSIINLKKELNLKIAARTFYRTLNKAICNSEWLRSGRSLVKNFGFTSC
jgi:hypothetical protein